MSAPIDECGEPLIDLRTVAALRLDPHLGDIQVRVGVVDRLITSQTLLPAGLRLLICGYLCDEEHVGGAAVDLTLCRTDGTGVDEPHGLLAEVLDAVGMVNGASDRRHWSYGDVRWARITGAPAARYGPC